MRCLPHFMTAEMKLPTGGTGFALVQHLSRIGVGISSLVSLGDTDDVSGTDMLLWWDSDPATKLALLYVESIRNPPKFARTARHVGRSVPVLTVIVGRSITGRRLAGARAAAATPLLTRQALFEQAGVIAVANLGELLDTAALLASQPAPAGPGSPWCPTPAAPRSSPPTRAATRACRSPGWPGTPSGRCGTCFPATPR